MVELDGLSIQLHVSTMRSVVLFLHGGVKQKESVESLRCRLVRQRTRLHASHVDGERAAYLNVS
jgi:hypothetical protein